MKELNCGGAISWGVLNERPPIDEVTLTARVTMAYSIPNTYWEREKGTIIFLYTLKK